MDSVGVQPVAQSFLAWLNYTSPVSTLSPPIDSRLITINTVTSPGDHAGHLLQSIKFNPTIGTILSAEHMDITFNCSIDVPKSLVNQDFPPITLWKNGKEILDVSSHYYQFDDNELTTMKAAFSIPNAHHSDKGSYSCKLTIENVEIESDPILVLLEGLPHFIKQPQGLNVTRNEPFNLTCHAVGPPDWRSVQMYLHFGISDYNFGFINLVGLLWG
uniref:Ig-like domain-containing protein n=1 Tax=Laticauda laticaudata TaxID=8630 RepID=A0A8C5SN78_LATLA